MRYFVFTVMAVLNGTTMLILNGLFVYGVDSASPSLTVILELSLAAVKLIWNDVVVRTSMAMVRNWFTPNNNTKYSCTWMYL